MPDSSNPLGQNPAYPANCADSSTRSDEAKITSYMWYIHVTVRVNAADRLRDSLAQILGQRTTTTPASPSYSTPFGSGEIENASSGSGSSSTLGHRCDGASAANKLDDLADYLVLQFFSQAMLETLVNTAPIEEQTEGYNRILAGIPVRFREEFCRRLYCLLFSKYILEWPQGIAVPEPAPGSIAAEAVTSTGSGAAVSERKRSSVQTSQTEDDDKEDDFMFDMEEIYTDNEDNDIFDGETYMYLASPEPASPGYQSTLGPSSPWPDMSSLGYSPDLARAAYLGTVSTPLPIQYRGSWGRRSSISSSRDDGPARAACAEEEAKAYAAAGSGAGVSHDERRLLASSPSRRPQRHHPAPAPPHHTTTTTTTTTTPQAVPASQQQLGSPAHSRDSQQRVVSHTGSCCPCRVREARSHGVGGQR